MELNLKDIEIFSKEYNRVSENKKIEKNITEYGLEKACINEEIIKENQPIFNIELSETKRYDQKESLRCWVFSGINMIKRDMANNLNIDIMNFELSDNFVTFFHRLEKTNTIYEKIISTKTTDLMKIVKRKIFKNPIQETGNWENFVNIVKKYGLVPLKVMPNTIEGERYIKVENLYVETVRKNALELAKLKKQNMNIKEIRKVKKKMLSENYEFLSKVYGEPKQVFDYEYTDKEGKSVILKDMTPNKFVKQFLSIDIENFILISNVPQWNRAYGQKIKDSKLINIRKTKYIEYLHISSQELKQLAIKQLKDNIPVAVGISIMKFSDHKSGILDTRLYDYEKLIKYKKLSKEEGLTIGDIFIHHWMTITGVYIENESPKIWKVEDSYGDKEKINGYYIMNDNYFTDYVFTVIIHKKYLSKEQMDLYNQEAIIEK